MIAFYLMLISCNEKQNEDTATEEETEEETQDDTATEEEEEDTATEEEEEEEEEEEQETNSVCGPKPNLQTADISLDLFDVAMSFATESCFLDDVDVTLNGQSENNIAFDAPTALECDDDGNCVQTLPSFATAWVQSNEYDMGMSTAYGDLYEGVVEGQRVIFDGVETLELTLRAKPSGSTASRDIVRVYDVDGNLLTETYHFNNSRWFEVNNRWEDGHLVEQDMFDYINSVGSEVNLSWSYDEEGRMVGSQYIDQHGNISSASFTYNEEGLLLGLTRDLDGEIFLTQSWTYEDGVLVSRDSIFSSGFMWNTSADNANIQSPLDYSSHWDQSLQTTMDDCSLPPFSLFHGYPDDETIYQLGWSKDDVPNQVGFAYNYNGYGWMYGDLSWFGHGGIASMYGIENIGNESQIQNTINYQDGVMTDETLSITDDNGNGNSATRIRTIQNGLILIDEVISTTETTEGTTTRTETLSFTYNQAGQLTTRDLHQDDIHTHQNTWTYNGEGHLSEHKISRVDSLETAEMGVLATFRQTITDDGTAYERIRERQNGGEGEWMEIDTNKRGTHSRGRFESHDQSFVVFDSDENMVMRGQGEPESPTYYNTYFNNDFGYLGTWERGDYDGINIHSYNYTCD